MSTEKKVLFLFLTLIILIVTCVYTHVDDLKTEENTTVDTSVESDSFLIIDAIKEKVKSFISPVEEEITQEKVIQEEIPVIEKAEKSANLDKTIETQTVQEDTTTENKISEENITDSSNKNESNTEVVDAQEKIENTEQETIENVVEEEKIEEPVKPLITTDKRYTRTGDEKNIENLSEEAQLLQIKMNEFVKENPIIFKRGSNKITRSSNKTIKSVVEALKEFPTMKIEVAGHTDAIGAAAFNKTISEQRAISVKKRLVYYGVEANRIKARGYGEDIPLVKNSKNGYSKINRRVEFNIIEE
ncbi:OmpA family protein [Arcobacter sp. LA11]|uniref:OmpA family protein n=1 Tax=Arcobacter sp. LA11 TaxID=1898176 RepID=UPI000933C113|nr:OmpA family protein [Arcobacter sp. LA11]